MNFLSGFFGLTYCFCVLAGVASGATRAALTQHFALANNAADISAKVTDYPSYICRLHFGIKLFLKRSSRSILNFSGGQSGDTCDHVRDGIGNAAGSHYQRACFECMGIIPFSHNIPYVWWVLFCCSLCSKPNQLLNFPYLSSVCLTCNSAEVVTYLLMKNVVFKSNTMPYWHGRKLSLHANDRKLTIEHSAKEYGK